MPKVKTSEPKRFKKESYIVPKVVTFEDDTSITTSTNKVPSPKPQRITPVNSVPSTPSPPLLQTDIQVMLSHLRQQIQDKTALMEEVSRLQNVIADKDSCIQHLYTKMQDLSSVSLQQQQMLQKFAVTHVEHNVQSRLQHTLLQFSDTKETPVVELPTTSPTFQMSEILTQELSKDATVMRNPTWLKLNNPELDNMAISVWDRKRLLLLGCNKSYCQKLNISENRLKTQRKNIHYLDNKPTEALPYLEAIMFSLLNSSVKFVEINTTLIDDTNRELYLRDRMYLEGELFWICHTVVDYISDDYRFDELHHPQTYRVPYDPTGQKRFMDLNPPTKKVTSFLDVLRYLDAKRKRSHTVSQAEFTNLIDSGLESDKIDNLLLFESNSI
ncbi:hypothetical protein AKO1_003874 [Acrasis kona]|uniref:Uncharacterized protein n=1 Tax=Acrasis kona TaxID=1008807 RepID=A0AAW2ZFV2_9EUKA